MADAATQTQDPSPDIASLTGGGPPSGSSAIADLTKLKKQQLGEESKVIAREDRTVDRDQARMEQAFKAEGVEPEALKPWDANKEHEKFESDPIQGIGSVGGLFAVIASAFTKAPATNAIEGMAGAINAIKDGNEASYNRAFESYKNNTKLALDRQKIQHEQYQDATSLMASNMAAGQAKMHNLAVKFGDQNTLMLLEHGMNKELFEMQAARASAAEKWAQYSETLTTHQFQKLAIDQVKQNPTNTGNPAQDRITDAAKVMNIFKGGGQKIGTAEQEAVGAYYEKNKDKIPPDQFIDGLAKLHQQFSPKAQGIEAYEQAKASWREAHPGEQISPEDDAKMLQQFGLAGTQHPGGTGNSSQANKTKAIEEIIAKHKAEGKDISRVDAEAEYKRTVSVPSGNRLDDLHGKIDQTDNIMTGIDKQLDTLNKIKGVSGLAGKIMRGEEIVGNIAGTTDTDRVEFRRRVHELQEMVPRIITDASGRPLKSAQDKVDDIVAGLNAGDTGPNTIRAYEELREEIKKRQGDYKARKTGQPAGTSEPAATGNTDWLNAYPEKR